MQHAQPTHSHVFPLPLLSSDVRHMTSLKKWSKNHCRYCMWVLCVCMFLFLCGWWGMKAKAPEPWAHGGYVCVFVCVCAQPEALVLGCTASHAGVRLGLSGREEWEVRVGWGCESACCWAPRHESAEGRSTRARVLSLPAFWRNC